MDPADDLVQAAATLNGMVVAGYQCSVEPARVIGAQAKSSLWSI